MPSLFEECLEALESYQILTEGSEEILSGMFSKFRFENNRLDWENYSNHRELMNISHIPDLISKSECYIVWDEPSLPIIKTNILSILKCIDDVTAVSFDTWLLSLNFDWIIEFYHEGEIKLLVQ